MSLTDKKDDPVRDWEPANVGKNKRDRKIARRHRKISSHRKARRTYKMEEA